MNRLFFISTLSITLLLGCNTPEEPVIEYVNFGVEITNAVSGEFRCETTMSVFDKADSTLIDTVSSNGFNNELVQYRFDEVGQYRTETIVSCKCLAAFCLPDDMFEPLITATQVIDGQDSEVVGEHEADLRGGSFTVDITIEEGNTDVIISQNRSALAATQVVGRSSTNALAAGVDTQCVLANDTGHFGGFGFHNAQIVNTGSQAVTNWEARIDFGQAIPNPEWSWGGSFSVEGNEVVIKGGDTIEPGKSASFGVGGQYSGDQEITVSCSSGAEEDFSPVTPVPEEAYVMTLEFVEIQDFGNELLPEDFIAPQNVAECNLSNTTAQYGGFGFHNVTVNNTSDQTLDTWKVAIDFGSAIPNPQWSWGGDYAVEGNFVVITGTSPLAAGQQTSFGVGGQYSGDTNISVTCSGR
ncbi:MAG: cellulose binding domain-containing protein [Pseudomonadota bacterium]